MKFLVAVFLITLAGCATQPPPTAIQVGNETILSQRNEMQKLSRELENRKKKLEAAKLKEEIEQLNKEIAELNAEMDALEKRILAAEMAQTRPIYSAPSGGTTVGPRGGEYTWSKSGKKVYKKK